MSRPQGMTLPVAGSTVTSASPCRTTTTSPLPEPTPGRAALEVSDPSVTASDSFNRRRRCMIAPLREPARAREDPAPLLYIASNGRSGRRHLLDPDLLDHQELGGHRRLSASPRYDRGVGDVVEHLAALGHLPEDRVVLLEAITEVIMHDEELAALGVGTGVRHRQGTAHVVEVIARQLVLEPITRPAGARAGRIATLHHEARDDAVDRSDVVESIRRQTNEVVHGVRRRLGVELEDHLALVGDHGGDIG